jgi:hypothetical protein
MLKEPIALNKLRQLLGPECKTLSDLDLSAYRDELYRFAAVILDVWEEFNGWSTDIDAILEALNPSHDERKRFLAARGYRLVENDDWTNQTLAEWQEGLV